MLELGVDVTLPGAEEMELSRGLAAAIITQVEEARTPHIELYDSGATRHISPYRDITYQTLDPPLYLNAVNGQQFPALGTGDMVVRAPTGGGGQSELTLKNVFHALSVGYTLISLGALDSLGYDIAIGSGHLEILLRTGERLAHIPKSAHSLYCHVDIVLLLT